MGQLHHGKLMLNKSSNESVAWTRHRPECRAAAAKRHTGEKKIKTIVFVWFVPCRLIFMHSHISSVIYAFITQKEMYLVSHVLNCINWKRGLTLCPRARCSRDAEPCSSASRPAGSSRCPQPGPKVSIPLPELGIP